MKNNYAYYITSLLFLLFCVSCENEEGVIGSSIIVDENHNIVSYPTDEATASFIQYSNMLASELDISLLGYYNDNVFGTQYGSCAFQIRPDTLIEGTVAEITGITLKIPYADESITAEDIITDWSIGVYKVLNSLNDIDNLYTHQIDVFNATNISTEDCIINNINILSAESTGELTLDLTNCEDIKNSLLNAFMNSDNEDIGAFQNGFLNTFHGIHLTPIWVSPDQTQPAAGGIMELNTTDAILDVEYSTEKTDAITIQCKIGSDELINLTFLTNNFTNLDTTNNIYLQSMGGSYSEIDMQFLTSLKEEGYIAVNDAELILHISEENGNFLSPNNLALYQFSDNESIDFANATPISESDDVNTENQTYMFNMTGLIHEIINGEREPIFQLYLNSPKSEMDRLILDNPFVLNLLLIKEEN